MPAWWHPGIEGQAWLIEDELFVYSRGTLLIWRDGRFETAYPAEPRHVENVLRKRLWRLGWKALWRAPRVGRRQVLAYLGMEERAGCALQPEGAT